MAVQLNNKRLRILNRNTLMPEVKLSGQPPIVLEKSIRPQPPVTLDQTVAWPQLEAVSVDSSQLGQPRYDTSLVLMRREICISSKLLTETFRTTCRAEFNFQLRLHICFLFRLVSHSSFGPTLILFK